MFYFFWLRILAFLAKRVYHVEYKGVENIPHEGKLIVCSNHKSVIDPLFLAVPFERQIRYMAKSELFEDHGKLACWILYKLGAFPVRRNKGDARSVRTALQILNDGGVLGIFPQGKCVFDTSPFRPKAGAAFIALKAQAPVLPVSIYCDGVIKPFRKVTIRFGKPIPYAELSTQKNPSASVRAAAEMIAVQINKMLEEKN